MATTMGDMNMISLAASADKTSDIFTRGIHFDSIFLDAGATGGTTVITMDGVQIHNATVAADASVEITPHGTPMLVRDIVATTLGTNVVCFVHVV